MISKVPTVIATWASACSLGLFFAASVVGAEGTKLYGVDRGAQAIQTVSSELKDKQRDKTLPLRLTFPKAEGKYPVIIFSHGAMGSNEAYAPLIEHWASHGYVCIQPTHEDSLKLMLASGERFQLQNVWAKWDTRPPDIRLILDSLKQLEADTDGLNGKIDHERIGMGGHSFGAHTSQLIGGVKMRNPVTKRFQTYDDPRPDAFLLISPQGTGDALVEESYSGLKRPTLVITGTRRFSGSGPANVDHVNYVKSASLAFWDAFLKADDDAKPWMQTGTYDKATDGRAKFTSKQGG